MTCPTCGGRNTTDTALGRFCAGCGDPAENFQPEDPRMSQTAQQAEAANAPVKAHWRDRDWTAPAPADWPWDVLEAIDEEKFTVALKGLLGDQYKAFKKLNPTVTDGGELLEALVKGAGFDGSGE